MTKNEKWNPVELDRLKKFCPTVETFRPQIRDYRINALVIASVFLVAGVGIALTAEQPKLERKQWLGATIALVSIGVQSLAIFAPATWVLAIVRIREDSDIDSVISSECKSGFDWVYFLKEFGLAYGVLIPLMFGGIWVWQIVSTFWGAIICVPTGLISVFRLWYISSRDASKVITILENMLPKRGYYESESLGVMLLGASFVNCDSRFEVEKSWQKRLTDVTVNWCMYTAAGNSMTAGIVCLSGFHGLTLSDMAERMKVFFQCLLR